MTGKYVFCVGAVALVLFFSTFAFAGDGITIVNPNTANATLMYQGKPLFKIGPLPEVVPFAVAWGSKDFDHAGWLAWMEEHRLGYGRVYPENAYPWTEYHADKRLFPFKTVRWENGKPIVDLTQFNGAYWDNFARVIKECADRGIILQMQLYQRVFFGSKPGLQLWESNYFNPENNVNGYPVPKGRGGYAIWKLMGEDTVWRGIHHQWVRHILDGIGSNGNVIIDLMNEGAFKNQLTEAWIESTIDLIDAWERETGNNILVGMDFDHLFKLKDPGLEQILAHPRLDVLICEGSEAHVVKELVAGDRKKLDVELALDYRRKYKKPMISTNSPGYSVHENTSDMRLYQWYALMVKVQGVGVYAKTYPLDFKDDQVSQYASESKILMAFFDTLRDYAALAPMPEKIESAPGRHQGLLVSNQELVLYLHHGLDADGLGRATGETVIQALPWPSGKVSLRFVDPRTGEAKTGSGRIRDGRLRIALPVFEEDLAIHVLRTEMAGTPMVSDAG